MKVNSCSILNNYLYTKHNKVIVAMKEMTRGELYNLYWNEEQGRGSIAKFFGVTEGKVRYLMKKWEIPTRSRAEASKVATKYGRVGQPNIYRNILSKEVLYDLYWNKRLSLSEIAKKFNVGIMTIHRYMIECDIPRRAWYDALYPKNTFEFKGMTETFAYILGVLYGDGYVHKFFIKKTNGWHKNGYRYTIGLNAIDEIFVDKFASKCRELGFNVFRWVIHAEGRKDVFGCLFRSKPFYEWFKSEGFDGHEELILKSNMFWNFIEGFYESEGTLFRLKRCPNSFHAGMCNTNKQVLKSIHNFLLSQDITAYFHCQRCGGKHKDIFVINIDKKKSIIKFLNSINPIIKIGVKDALTQSS